MRRFWERAVERTNEQTQKRFIDVFTQYTAAVVQEASDRADHRVRSIHDYLVLRRGTAAIAAAVAPLEFAFDIPAFVFEDATMKNLYAWIEDILIVINVSVFDVGDLVVIIDASAQLSQDMYSFNVEQARGDPHNLISAVMHDASGKTSKT